MELEKASPNPIVKLLEQFVVDNDKVFPIRYRTSNTVEEITRSSGLPFLPIIGIAVPHEEMLREAQNLSPIAVPHRSIGESNLGWKSISLHGVSSKLTEGAERYGLDPLDLQNYQWTAASELCPITTHFLKHTLHYKAFYRVRFMYLAPGGYIMPHRDVEAYHLAPTNIALSNPEGCRMIMENVGVVPFQPGQINKLALINRHCVWNRSNEERIHMIVHGHPDLKYWSKIFEDSYRSLVHGQSATRFLAI
jgi:hypothetical protein